MEDDCQSSDSIGSPNEKAYFSDPDDTFGSSKRACSSAFVSSLINETSETKPTSYDPNITFKEYHSKRILGPMNRGGVFYEPIQSSDSNKA